MSVGTDYQSRTASLPVRYVFPKRSLEVKSVADALYTTAFPGGNVEVDESLEDGALSEDREERGKKGVVVFWDVAYDWIEGMPIRPTTVSLLMSRSQMRWSRNSGIRPASQVVYNMSCLQQSIRLVRHPAALAQEQSMLEDAAVQARQNPAAPRKQRNKPVVPPLLRKHLAVVNPQTPRVNRKLALAPKQYEDQKTRVKPQKAV